MKCAAYCMTRNLYPKVVPSLNSLLKHSNVDRVYLLTEDDDIGFEIPSRVRIVNVRDQQYFSKDGPNYHRNWTYMVMMRTVLFRMFPELDRILTLDLDTIVEQDISELWEIDLRNFYLAGVPEPDKTGEFPYVNCGVVMWNLDALRDGMGDAIIRSLNTERWEFCEQDCVNALCRDMILELPSDYNVNKYTQHSLNPKIFHFACTAGWYERHPLVQKYKEEIR